MATKNSKLPRRVYEGRDEVEDSYWELWKVNDKRYIGIAWCGYFLEWDYYALFNLTKVRIRKDAIFSLEYDFDTGKYTSKKGHDINDKSVRAKLINAYYLKIKKTEKKPK